MARVLKQCGHWVIIFPQVDERLGVLEGELLEHVLVAGPPGRVAIAELAGPQDGERDPRSVEQAGQGDGDCRVAIVEGAGTADEPQVLGLEDLAFAQHRHLEVELLDPVRPLFLADPPGIPLVLHGDERLAELGGKVRLHQGQVAAHVEDPVEDLDPDGADLVTGLAGGARPRLDRLDPGEQLRAFDHDALVQRHRR